jgi:hypothetical protein
MSDYKITRPGGDEYPTYFDGYVSLVPEGDVLELLGRQVAETAARFFARCRKSGRRGL